MKKSVTTTITFVLIILFLVLVPIITPPSYAIIEYENVSEITDFTNTNGKVFKSGTRISEQNINIEYYIEDIKIADYTLSGNDVIIGSQDSDYIDLTAISEYWEVISVTNIQNNEKLVKLRAVYEKYIGSWELEEGDIVKTGSPIMACSRVEYQNPSGEIFYESDLDYTPHTHIKDVFESNMYYEDYYVALTIPDVYSSYDTGYWEIIEYDASMMYAETCTNIVLRTSPPRNYYKATVNNNNNMGRFSFENIQLSSKILESTPVEFTVTPKDGYEVASVDIKKSNNETITPTLNNNYSFTMPTSNVTITPVYQKVKSSVNVEIVNETENFEINLDDLTKVEYGEEVVFQVTPIKGHKVTSIRIIDENNNDVEFTETNNANEFQFTMPYVDVTIIPSYERVKNAVNVEDNKNTKEFVIEVNDSQAVVYEDTVRFRVEPEEGYEVESIDIRDEEQNKINYRKTNTVNEYEFTMPDTDVLIKPKYRLIPNNNSSIFNPNTGRVYLLIILVLTIIGIVTYKYKKKRLNN